MSRSGLLHPDDDDDERTRTINRKNPPYPSARRQYNRKLVIEEGLKLIFLEMIGEVSVSGLHQTWKMMMMNVY